MASDRPDPDAPPPADGADHAEVAEGTLDRGLALIRFLRANCPWDEKQTHESLVPYLLEESHEVVEAIHAGDDRELEGELGDLLLNLAFQVVVGEERGAFTADSVTRRIEEKMRRRHPHLYGLGPQESWESIKSRERGNGEATDDPGILSGIPNSLDPLTRAFRIQDRAARVGFDWEDWRGALAKVSEELEEVREELEARPGEEATPALEEELGDLLFAVVNVVRLAGTHPVRALDRANRKFMGRFEALETLAREQSVVWGEATLDELDALWDEVKRRER